MVLGHTSSYFLYNVRYSPLDSINLVFEGFDDPQAIVRALIGSGTGWTTWSLQARQYLQDDRIPVYLRQESSFVVKARAMSTRLGPVGFQHFWRFHLRLWEHQHRIVGCAHEEGPALFRLPRWLARALPIPIHNVVSFDRGRQEVVDAFRNIGVSGITDCFLEVGTRIYDPACDGWATLIQR